MPTIQIQTATKPVNDLFGDLNADFDIILKSFVQDTQNAADKLVAFRTKM